MKSVSKQGLNALNYLTYVYQSIPLNPRRFYLGNLVRRRKSTSVGCIRCFYIEIAAPYIFVGALKIKKRTVDENKIFHM